MTRRSRGAWLASSRRCGWGNNCERDPLSRSTTCADSARVLPTLTQRVSPGTTIKFWAPWRGLGRWRKDHPRPKHPPRRPLKGPEEQCPQGQASRNRPVNKGGSARKADRVENDNWIKSGVIRAPPCNRRDGGRGGALEVPRSGKPRREGTFRSSSPTRWGRCPEPP